MTNLVLRLIWCLNVSVAMVAVGVGSAFWAALNAGCALAVTGVLVQRGVIRRADS